MLTSYFLLKLRKEKSEISAIEQILVNDHIRDKMLEKFGRKRRYRKRGQNSSNVWKMRLKEYFEKNKIEMKKVTGIFQQKSDELRQARPEFIKKMQEKCLAIDEMKKFVETQKIICPINLTSFDIKVNFIKFEI